MYPPRTKAEALAQRGYVVVRLHNPTDQVPNVRHLRVQHTFSPMTSLELQSSHVLRESFVGTMMLLYRRRASPKHRYSPIEVDYGGGGHRTRRKDQINCWIFGGPAAPVYKGARGR